MRYRPAMTMQRVLIAFLAAIVSGCPHSGGTRTGSASVADGAGSGRANAEAVAGERMKVAHAEAEREFGLERLFALAGTDSRSATRLLALRGIGRVGGDRAVAFLARALRSPSAPIREQAAHALGMAGAETAEGALINRYGRETSGRVRAAIVLALGRVGGGDSLELLSRALAQPDTAERAALALGRFGRRKKPLDDPTRRALLAAADSASTSGMRFALAFAFAREPDPPRDRLSAAVATRLQRWASDGDAEVRATALAALSRRTDATQPMLAALADPDWRVRVTAVRALAAGDVGPDTRSALAAFTAREWALLVAAKWLSPRVHTVIEAMRGLAAHAREASVSRLATALYRAADEHLARSPGPAGHAAVSAVHCLAAALRVRGGAAMPLLRDCGGPRDRGLPVHERRALVAQAVADGHGGTPEQRLAVLHELYGDTDGRVRATAIAVIAEMVGKSGSAAKRRELMALLVRALADPSVEVVGAAALGVKTLAEHETAELAELARPIASGPLLARAESEKVYVELLISLVDALVAARVDRAVKLCRRLHSHENVTLRATARRCLTALESRDPGPGRATHGPTLPPVDPAETVGETLLLDVVTSKGDIAIALDGATAPWHLATIAHLVGKGFYRSLLWHRVVPNFVVQGGDPLGSGWGGLDFMIPAEPSAEGFVRGAVGIADTGLDTGGCQWFIMHSRAPHLDGRYTVIGRVIAGQEVVDMLTVGDRILEARIRGPAED